MDCRNSFLLKINPVSSSIKPVSEASCFPSETKSCPFLLDSSFCPSFILSNSSFFLCKAGVLYLGERIALDLTASSSHHARPLFPVSATLCQSCTLPAPHHLLPLSLAPASSAPAVALRKGSMTFTTNPAAFSRSPSFMTRAKLCEARPEDSSNAEDQKRAEEDWIGSVGSFTAPWAFLFLSSLESSSSVTSVHEQRVSPSSPLAFL